MKAYLSYSTDNDIRYRASSGGFCKELMKFLIKNQIYDKVILTELGDGNLSLVSQTVITDNIEKILSVKSNTIYGNTNPLSVLNELNKNESYIFVGLPCHIKTVREYSKKNDIKILTICLFCNHTPDYGYTKYILDKHNVKKNDVIHFEYRGSGWPGNTKIKTKNGESMMNFPALWSRYNDHTPTPLKKCKCCVDFISSEADICVGDAWVQRIIEKDKLGTNIVIGMNEIGNDLIKKCYDNGHISIEDWNEDEFKNHIKSALNQKIIRKNRWCS